MCLIDTGPSSVTIFIKDLDFVGSRPVSQSLPPLSDPPPIPETFYTQLHHQQSDPRFHYCTTRFDLPPIMLGFSLYLPKPNPIVPTRV